MACLTVVLQDIHRLVSALGAISLEVNSGKFELTVIAHADVDLVLRQFTAVISDVRLVERARPVGFSYVWSLK